MVLCDGMRSRYISTPGLGNEEGGIANMGIAGLLYGVKWIWPKETGRLMAPRSFSEEDGADPRFEVFMI
jgi:hypothetical protein